MKKYFFNNKNLTPILVSILIAPSYSHAEESHQLPTMEVRGDAMQGIPLDLPTTSGSRLGLTIFETPASIDVVTHETMQERGFRTTLQALDSMVGVQSGQCFGLVCFSTRGFAGTTSLPFLFNGNRYPGLAMSPRSTFNYDRIEVIKGPSSVLHGLGSMTGAVNYITKGADGREETEIEVGYGSWDTRHIGIGKGGRINDRAAYRADFNYVAANEGSYGFVDRTSYEDYHLSGELAFDVTNNLHMSLRLDTFKDQGEGYFGTPIVDGKIDERVIRNNYNIQDDRISKKVIWLTFSTDWQINDQLSLHNETYVNREDRLWHNAERNRFNSTTGLIGQGDFLHINHDQRLYGNRTELTLDQSFGNIRNRLLVGFDYSFNRHQRTNNSPYGGSETLDFLNPSPGLFNSPDPFLPQRLTNLDSYGIYIEDFINLTEAFKVSLSLRHDIADLDSFDLRADSDFSKHYSSNSWRIGALYDIRPNLTLYAQWGRAFEPPSQIVTLAESRKELELTHGRQVEIGMKGSFLDGRAEATVSLFDISRKNILTRDPDDPTKRNQIGEQVSRGIEVSGSFRPTKQWALNANFAVIDAEYAEFFDRSGGVAVSRAGNLPKDVPEEVANLWISWHPMDKLRIGTGVHYVAERAANRANTVFMDSYTTVDAYIGTKLGLGDLTLHVRNLTDELYSNHSYSGGQQFMLGEERAWELIWRARF